MNLPVTHLDAIYFDDEWNPLPMENFAAVQRNLVAERKWVLDGNYNSTLSIRLEACDTVVFMDVSTLSAMWGILWRQLRYGPGQKGEGIHNRISWSVIRYVATYRRKMRLRVIEKVNKYAAGRADVVILTSRRHAARWLRQVSVYCAG